MECVRAPVFHQGHISSTVLFYITFLLIFIIRTAEKKLGTKMKAVIKEMQKTMGVQMFVIAGFRRPNGELSKLV
jgi:hypothetical protein